MKNLPFSKIRLLFLGSGELGKELVIESKRLGCEVITVDKYKNAPAMQVSDRHFVLDMSNKDLLKGLINELNPDYVIPEIESLSIEDLGEALKIKEIKAGLSMPDCSVLFLAQKHDAILLSGD